MGRRFLFLEPFGAGSHRQFAEGLAAASGHHIDLVSLPGRFWKWRMRGAAIYWAPRLGRHLASCDGLILSGLMSLTDFKALCPVRLPPALVYFHETQLTYPLAPGQKPDHQYGFTEIATALCADRVVFNSHSHAECFFRRLPAFIRMMPDCRPTWAVAAIQAKATVCHPGCALTDPQRRPLAPWPATPLIVWNHRWEFDKQPEVFFAALERLANRGLDFQVAVLGQRYRRVPAVFAAAAKRLEKHIVQWGAVASKAAYDDWLRRSTLVVSTAIQENFGLAVVEAVHAGCLPLLPARLSYPELVPAAFHAACLWTDPDDLAAKLTAVITAPERFEGLRRPLSDAMDRFRWARCIDGWDALLTDLAALGRPA